MATPLDEAIANAPRDTWLDELAYTSLLAAQAKYYAGEAE